MTPTLKDFGKAEAIVDAVLDTWQHVALKPNVAYIESRLWFFMQEREQTQWYLDFGITRWKRLIEPAIEEWLDRKGWGHDDEEG